MVERRWHALWGEWILVSASRMARPFLPPKEKCPLCPGVLEIPEEYDLAVFENRFPGLSSAPDRPQPSPHPFYKTAPSHGVCEVVMYTSEHDTSLAEMPVDDIYRLMHVWVDRYKEISSRPEIECVYIFENKGEEVGVTLHHPHSQIYAFPFIPPRLQTELNNARESSKQGKCLFCSIVEAEKQDGRRILAETERFIAYLPYFARWSYEVHIAARHGTATMADFDDATSRELAQVLKLVICKFDNLFETSFPYMMVMHQLAEPDWHFHIEFYPPYRDKGKLKYVAGVESGAGNFVVDSYPEMRATQLQEIPPFQVEPVTIQMNMVERRS
ncbi:MAG: galactose-1-phosphate uridylyltransferase [Armatimonadetes bacterium]|nr:galactose-1-phosphate uridylyltransferase [Armatimonadota bacterium]NIO74881.1 galactose-1-phosphate uridylyltransferase [Armatimonadota bacterium]NIO95642.1 galactose-1-phosphate uridylyltransferase [Armatimonadota bacterium]